MLRRTCWGARCTVLGSGVHVAGVHVPAGCMVLGRHVAQSEHCWGGYHWCTGYISMGHDPLKLLVCMSLVPTLGAAMDKHQALLE